MGERVLSAGCRRAFRCQDRRGPAPLLAQDADDVDQPGELERFLQVRRGARWHQRRLDDGQNQDGDGSEAWIPHLLTAKFPSVHDRHHEIEHDEVGERGAFEMVERLASVLGGHDVEPRPRKPVANQTADVRVVVNDENAALGTHRMCIGLLISAQ